MSVGVTLEVVDDEEPRPGRDSAKDWVRRFLDGSSSFMGLSRSDLEGLVSELFGKQGKGRERVEDLFEEVRARSRQGVDRVGGTIRSEVRREFDIFTPERREQIGEFLERLVGLIGEYFGPSRHHRDHAAEEPEAALPVAGEPAADEPPEAERSPAKASSEKASGTKKAPAKKAAAKKATKKPPAA
jgi:hypothetical protein